MINYTYVDDVMRIWQGPEARPDREFMFPEEGHVKLFPGSRKADWRLDMLSNTHLPYIDPRAWISLKNHSTDFGIL